MSDNSLYLRTNSIHFSSIFKDNKGQQALFANKCLKYSGGDGRLVHTIGIEEAQAGMDLFRQANHSRSATEIGRNCDVIELRCDGDVPVSVNNSV
jgi:hypothetical protein